MTEPPDFYLTPILIRFLNSVLQGKCISQDAVKVVEAACMSSSTKELLPVQNSVKSQLLLQALPPYVPPNLPDHQYSPEQYFPCKDCGDK